MVLLVKLKKPNLEPSELSDSVTPAVTSEEEGGESQGESKSNVQGPRPTDRDDTIYIDRSESDESDRALISAQDEPSDAFSRLQIHIADEKDERQTQDAKDNSVEELSSAFAQSSIEDQSVSENKHSSLSSALVDILIAPAVLGHRYVRGRDTSFIVERPERIRAVLLGIAAFLGRLNSQDSTENLATRLSNLDLQSVDHQFLSLLLSSRTLELQRPTAALEYIHAHPDELLDLERQGDASLYATRKTEKDLSGHSATQEEATRSSSKKVKSYAHFLVDLCMQAPYAPPPPSSPRKYRSPRKEEIQHSPTFSSDEEDGGRLSEVPLHLPQGDLYLCGALPHKKKESEDTYFGMQTPMGGEVKEEDSTDQGPTTPGSTPTVAVNNPQTPQPAKSVEPVEETKENVWTREGTRGAIEAALGACCEAVDRVMTAHQILPSNQTQGDSPFCRPIDVSRLLEPQPVEPLFQDKSTRVNSEGRRPAKRTFVLTRPPGHHCSATQPSGFCWVNNVAVLAAHAYEAHGVDRVAVLDIDLHHGNGTQSLAWRINADTVAKDLEREAKMATPKERTRAKGTASRDGRKSGVALESTVLPPEDIGKRGLKMFYGSLHDIESFPCEDGDATLVRDASTCIMGAHGQWIWNVHLDSHSSPSEFASIYREKYARLFSQARQFFSRSDSTAEKSLVVISTGFDACQHELPGMQRHGKFVPVEFYEAFTRDAVHLAEEVAGGKVISVLEGGYSDRALTSGTMAHLLGMSGLSNKGEKGVRSDVENAVAASLQTEASDWHSLPNLIQLERMSKKALSAFTINQYPAGSVTPGASLLAGTSSSRKRQDPSTQYPRWLLAASEAFRRLEESCGIKSGRMARKRLLGEKSAPTTPANHALLFNSPRELRSARGMNSSGS